MRQTFAKKPFRSFTLGAAALTIGMAACGTTRTQPMPLKGSEAPQAIDPLLVCATKMNLQAKQDGDKVIVPLENGSRVEFKTSEEKSLVMETHVDGAEDDPETKRKLATAKATGTALFNCALKVPTPASSSPNGPTPTLGNTTTAPGH